MSTETPVEPPKRGPGRPLKAKTIPAVSVVDRRLQHPFGAPSVAIELKTPGLWAIRVANRNVRAGRLHDMTHNKGWVYVVPEELDGLPEEYGFQVKDGRLVRGEHGEEVLMKMPQKDFDQIQAAKAELNLKNLGGKATKEAVQQETALKYGDQAASVIGNTMTVVDGRERSELE